MRIPWQLYYIYHMYQQLTWEFRISCADQNFPKEENGQWMVLLTTGSVNCYSLTNQSSLSNNHMLAWQFTVSSLIFLLHKIEQRNLFYYISGSTTISIVCLFASVYSVCSCLLSALKLQYQEQYVGFLV